VEAVIEVVAGALAALSGLAAAVGGWAWWQVLEARPFWVLLRTSQVAAVLLAALAGVAAALGHRPDSGLFWVYAIVPVAVGFVAEQLRVLSADSVLAARDIPDAQALGRRSEEEQRSVVVAIVRRETGIMALAALVTLFLALRALGTAGGL
jgi:hypothetical protein